MSSTSRNRDFFPIKWCPDKVLTTPKTANNSTVVDLKLSCWRDIRDVYQLAQDIFPKGSYPYRDLAILYLMPHITNIKAVDANGALLGFVAVSDKWLLHRDAWVVILAVQQHAQQQGIGLRLMEAVEKVNLRAQRLCLTVRAGNHAAISLYEKAGYKTMYSRPNHYSDGEDGLFLQKSLQTNP